MTNRSELIVKFWVPVFVWAGVISLLSSIPGGQIPKIRIPHIDKIEHAAEYAILGYLLIRALINSFKGKKVNSTFVVISAIIIASVYGMADEWHQRYVPDRKCDAVDFLFDLMGIIAGIYFYVMKERECRR